jgi:hypothetical protein
MTSWKKKLDYWREIRRRKNRKSERIDRKNAIVSHKKNLARDLTVSHNLGEIHLQQEDLFHVKKALSSGKLPISILVEIHRKYWG